MRRLLKKGVAGSDDLLGWIGLGLVLVAAIVLDKRGAPHKWHAAVMWTFCALFGLLIFARTKRSSWLFWIFWIVCLTLHAFTMWAIFARIFPRLILGTLYVVPIAFVEAIFLMGIFSRLERELASVHSRQDSSRMKSAHKK